MARQHQRKRLPKKPVTAEIETLSHDGRGIARINGKTTFIDGALTGESIRFSYTNQKKRFDEGRTIELLNHSADRVDPECRHFGSCGGCSLMHMTPQAQLNLKQNTLQNHLVHFGGLEPDSWLAPLTGPLLGYRRKARLGVRYIAKKDQLVLGFRKKASSQLTDIAECQVLDPRIGLRIAELKRFLSGLNAKSSISHIQVALDDEHCALIFRHVGALSAADKQALKRFGQQHDLWIYLQPGTVDSTYAIWPEAAQLSYQPEPGLNLQFAPDDFIQVNADINKTMIQQALDMLDLHADDRVLDLFCGLGNFTLPLAKRVNEVVGVEGDAALVQHGKDNAALNGLSNAIFEQADLTQTELKDYLWAEKGFNKILLDPPRNGAFEVLHQLADLGAERLLYVSCDPATLARDAGELVNNHGYTLLSAGIMDMFPHTTHVESIALFVK